MVTFTERANSIDQGEFQKSWFGHVNFEILSWHIIVELWVEVMARDKSLVVIVYGFPGASDSMQCQRPGFDPWAKKIPWKRKRLPTPVYLPGESPQTEEPGRLQSMGLQRVRQDWATNTGVIVYRCHGNRCHYSRAVVKKRREDGVGHREIAFELKGSEGEWAKIFFKNTLSHWFKSLKM